MLRRHRVDVRAHGRVGEAGDARVAVALPVGLAVEGDPAGDVEDRVEVLEADARWYVVLDLWQVGLDGMLRFVQLPGIARRQVLAAQLLGVEARAAAVAPLVGLAFSSLLSPRSRLSAP
jgi:hypothetical protein